MKLDPGLTGGEKIVTRCFDKNRQYRVSTMGHEESVLFGFDIGFYNKEFCCPLKQQSLTALVVQAKEGCVSVRKRERMLREHEMGGRDGEMDKCEWGD